MSTTINLTVGSSANDDCGSTAFGLLNSTVNIAGKIAGSSAIRYASRFTGATIPRGATIDSATFSVVAVDTDSSSTWSTKIHADTANNPSFPASGTAIDAISLTTAFCTPTSSLSTTSGVRYNFDVANVVQEKVNSSGWANGDAIQIIWVDNGSSSGINRRWVDFSSSSANQPKLDITYSTGNRRRRAIICGAGT